MRAGTLAATLLILVFALAAEAAGPRRQLWGAIAYNSRSGAYGYAVDRATKRAAETEAFRLCGNNCDVNRTFRSSCGAVAEDDRHFAWSTGATREMAEQKALAICARSTCKIIVWACTGEK